jgi:hypothetical protein
MATKRHTTGIDHFTVVPANFEPASDEDCEHDEGRKRDEE